MAVTPMPKNTTIYLCAGVPISADYTHTLYFDSKSAQKSAMSNYVRKTFTAQSYQRVSNGVLRIATLADEIASCNYLYFENTVSGLGVKTYYAFITDVRYINDSTAEVEYELDIVQSYLHDVYVKECFIEREHTRTDEIGENLVPEGIEIGEYTCSQTYSRFVGGAAGDPNGGSWYLFIKYISNDISHSASDNRFFERFYAPGSMNFPSRTASFGGNACFNGLPQPFTYLLMPFTNYPNLPNNGTIMLDLQSVIIALADMSCTIVGIDIIPEEIVDDYDLTDGDNGGYWSWVQSPLPHSWSLNMPTSFRSDNPDASRYTPKCKKLYTAPYTRLIVNNNQGEVSEFNWEDFGRASADTNPQATFNIYNVIFPQPAQHLCPMAYKGIPAYYEAGLSVSSFPTASWSEDSAAREYQFLQQQRDWSLISAGLNAGGALISAGIGAATGTLPFTLAHETRSFANAAMGAAYDIKDTMVAQERASAIPDNFKGKSTGSGILVREGRYGFSAKCMTVNAEMAEVIDNYFWMYGYAIHKVKQPDLFSLAGTTRPFWYYIQTKRAIVTARSDNSNFRTGVDASACASFAAILNRGITFWFNRAHVGDYGLNNRPVQPQT